MQTYNPLLPTGLISEDRQTINDNMECIITDFAGTAFPTNNLFEGMLCARKDQKKVYRLEEDLATWKLLYDYNGSEITVPKANKAVLDGDGKPINTTYLKSVPVYVGATTSTAGEAGLVKAPGINDREKFLKGNGEWAEVPKLTKLDLLDMIYPVGSIYMSVNATDPGSLFGGTWEKMPAGRVLIPEGESDWGTTYKAGETGGEATHTLTVDEMPVHTHTASSTATSHNHNISVNMHGWPDGQADATSSNIGYWNRRFSTLDSVATETNSHNHSITINNTGKSAKHNNMPPYLVCYMFRRIS